MSIPKLNLPIALAFCFLASLQLLALPGRYLGQEHDDAQFVLAAHGLLEGRYSLGISPGDPPLTIATPGYPLLLVPAALVFGERWQAYSIYAWLWLLACDVLVWLWLRRRWEAPAAVLGTAFFGLCPLVLSRAGAVMNELPALALILALFLALERPSWPAWASGISLAFLWLVRQASVALMPAVWSFYALRRRWRELAWSMIPSAVIVVGWTLWLHSVGARVPESEELARSYGRWSEVIAAFQENAVYYAHLWGAICLPRSPRNDLLELFWGALLALLVVYGVVRIYRREGISPPLAWIFFGGLMHLFWPWRYERYLLPFLPFLIWSCGEGLRSLWEWCQGLTFAQAKVNPWHHRMRWFCAGWLAAIFLTQGVFWISRSDEASRPELQKTYEWIRANTDERQVFSSFFYMRDALYAPRPFAPLPAADSAEQLRRELERHRISMILWQEPGDVGSSQGSRFYAYDRARRLRNALADPAFKLLYRNEEEGSFVYRVVER